jgi:hypothetical protein
MAASIEAVRPSDRAKVIERSAICSSSGEEWPTLTPSGPAIASRTASFLAVPVLAGPGAQQAPSLGPLGHVVTRWRNPA